MPKPRPTGVPTERIVDDEGITVTAASARTLLGVTENGRSLYEFYDDVLPASSK